MSAKWCDPYDRQVDRERRQVQIERQLRVDLGLSDEGTPTCGTDTSPEATHFTATQGNEAAEKGFNVPRDVNREGSRFNTVDPESRQAQRDRRRLQLERQMRADLGMKDEDGDEPTEGIEQSESGKASQGYRSRSAFVTRESKTGQFGQSNPMSSSSDPGSGFGRNNGPSRPPKPKPHRPLASHNQNYTACDPADVDGESKRWKSALLPIWKDRHAAIHACDPPEWSSSRDVPSPSHRSNAPSSHGSWVRGERPFGPSAEPAPSAPSPRVASPVSPVARQMTSTCPSLNIPASLRASPPTSLGSTLTNSGMASGASTSSGVSERTQMLEESARRLRQQSERVRVENRRARTFGPSFTNAPEGPATITRSRTEEVSTSNLSSPDSRDKDGGAGSPKVEVVDEYAQRRAEEMRKRIAELDEINLLEKERLEEEQRENERRRLQQEAFEKEIQERTERELREHQERQEREDREREQREIERERERKDRERRNREKTVEEEKEARLREEEKHRAREKASRMKWDVFEQELDSRWAEQEAEEKRRLEEYAAQRRKQYEEWDRRLNEERQRHINAENSCKTQRFVRGARNAAAADEAFYANKRQGPTGFSKAPPPPNAFRGSGASGYKPFDSSPAAPKVDTTGLSSEELSVLKELQSVTLLSRDTQKAKVKELLFKWHPDKNPDNTERATKVFQFVQKHKEVVLGL